MTTDLRASMPTKLWGNLVGWLWFVALRLWLTGRIAIVKSSLAAEAALSLIGIEIDGRAAGLVSEVAIIAPGQEKAERRELKKGAAIVRGSEIVIPPRTVLVLQSANGNQIRLQ